MKTLNNREEFDIEISEDQPLIEVKHLQKSFGDKVVLKDFSFELYPGENLAIMGRSGSGKSVLIKCIVGLLKPDSGTIKIFGKDILSLSRKEMDRIRLNIGFVFQRDALYDSMSVRENLEFPLLEGFKQQTDKNIIDQWVVEVLDSVGLKEAIDLMPSELSGGMRKRIGLARALMLKPRIMLYDEPTTGLDIITGKGISDLINKVRRQYGTSSVIISHDVKCVKDTSTRILLLKDGVCLASGTYDELKQSEVPDIYQFFE